MSKKTFLRIFYSICLFLVFIIIYNSTSSYGIGLSNDSISYFKISRLISNQGLLYMFFSKVAVLWPPIYPLLLSIFHEVFNLKLTTVANCINIISYITTLITIFLFFEKKNNNFLIIFHAIFLVFSIPLFFVSSMAWTETLFIMQLLILFWFVDKSKINISNTVIISLLTAIAFLTRYVGIVIIPTIVIYLYTKKIDKIKNIFLYLITTSIFVFPYLIRNYLISETLFGKRYPSKYSIIKNLNFFKETIGEWFLYYDHIYIKTFFLIFILFNILLFFKIMLKENFKYIKENSFFYLNIIFIFTYSAFILYSSSVYAYNKIGNRILSPIYPSIIIISFFIFFKIWKTNKKYYNLFLILVFLFLSIKPINTVYTKMNHNKKVGALGFNNKTWAESEILKYLKTNYKDKKGVIYTTAPKILYLYLNIHSSASPNEYIYNSKKEKIKINKKNIHKIYPNFKGATLIWFDRYSPHRYIQIKKLKTFYKLKLLNKFKDGSIYKVK